jgi:hypothetical protein
VSVDSTVAQASTPRERARPRRRPSAGPGQIAGFSCLDRRIMRWVDPGVPAVPGRIWPLNRRVRPLSVRLTPGQAGDNPNYCRRTYSGPRRSGRRHSDPDRLCWTTSPSPSRGAGGQPTSRPDCVIADKASFPLLNPQGIAPQGNAGRPGTQQPDRARRSHSSGRWPAPPFDAELDRERNVVERALDRLEQCAASPPLRQHARNDRTPSSEPSTASRKGRDIATTNTRERPRRERPRQHGPCAGYGEPFRPPDIGETRDAASTRPGPV